MLFSAILAMEAKQNRKKTCNLLVKQRPLLLGKVLAEHHVVLDATVPEVLHRLSVKVDVDAVRFVARVDLALLRRSSPGLFLLRRSPAAEPLAANFDLTVDRIDDSFVLRPERAATPAELLEQLEAQIAGVDLLLLEIVDHLPPAVIDGSLDGLALHFAVGQMDRVLFTLEG